MTSYDHIIIGTGQAAGTLLGKLTQEDTSIAVIEGGKVGGSCVNYGCTPTKTMVAAAKAFLTAQRGEFYGFHTGKIELDYARVRERMNEVRYASHDGLQDWLESDDKIDFYQDWGVFVGEKVVQVGDQRLEGKNIYINTGTRPFVPPIEGINEVPWMDSAGLLDLEELPQHLIIIGGGYIGVEFGQVFRRFGSKVTIIQSRDQLMPHEDKDVADEIQEMLTEESVEIMLNSRAKAVSGQNGNIELKIAIPDGEKIVRGTHLLLAVGRKPNVERLDLEKAGIKLDPRGYIQTDDYCRTNVAGVFALGDVNGKGAFTHTSVNDAEVVIDYLFGGKRKVSDRIPVYGLFSDPPLGRVGMTEKEALDTGKRLLKATKEMKTISRAKEMGETKGFAKLLVDADTDLIIGASILGPGGDEIINMFAAIMHSGIPCRNYREVVLVHPTVAELMPWVLDGLEEVG